MLVVAFDSSMRIFTTPQMGVSCTVNFITGEMCLVGEQSVKNHIGVRINTTAQFQTATHVRRFKMWYGYIPSVLKFVSLSELRLVLQILITEKILSQKYHTSGSDLQRRQMDEYYQHDGAPPHFSQVVRQYLNHKFPNRWIGRSGVQNWPQRSPELNPLYYHVWGYVKAMVYAHKVNTREELLKRILNAARSSNNAAMLRRVTDYLATRVRKCIQADGGHFEQFA